jgi:hypothetical protein
MRILRPKSFYRQIVLGNNSLDKTQSEQKYLDKMYYIKYRQIKSEMTLYVP